MDEEELRTLIAGGESTTVEFKLNAPWSAEMAERLCGLANSPLGGVLIIGVEDKTWAIKGVANPAAAIDEMLKGAALVSPPVAFVEPDPQTVMLDGQRLVVGRVSPNNGILHQAAGAYLLRRGTMTRPMDTAHVAEYMHRQGLVVWETQANLRATLDDLDMRVVERYLHHLSAVAGRPSRASSPVELLTLLECVAPVRLSRTGEEVTRPTNAGLLMFGDAPRYFYPQAEIICTYYRDDSGVRRYDDRRTITGPLTRQIEEAYAFLKLYTPVGARIEGFQRVEEPDLPLEALREAVVNAVVHRDYSLKGEAIRIFYYSNRVEVHSPGLLVPGLAIEELKAGRSRSKPRNPVLASLLRDMPGNYMERVGTGVPFMLNQMQAAGLPQPEFSQPGEFVVTFWRSESVRRTTPTPAPAQVYAALPQSEQLSPLSEPSTAALTLPAQEQRQRAALEYIRLNGSIGNKEHQRVTGASESTATRDLEGLVERGSLKRSGKGPARRYTLA